MTYSIVCPINHNKVTVNLPPYFRDKKQVTIVIDDHVDLRTQKLERLKNAVHDSLFLADILDIQKDFGSIDYETI